MNAHDWLCSRNGYIFHHCIPAKMCANTQTLAEMSYSVKLQLIGCQLSHAETSKLCITVDVQTIVLARENDRAVIHERDVEALCVFHLALKGVDQLTLLCEYCQVEVVVVVCDQNVARVVDADTYGVVSDALAPYLPHKHTLIGEHLNTVGAVVADEDLFLVVYDNAVRELKVFRAAELVEHVPHLVEDDDTHDLALDDDDAPLVVDGDAARMLQDVGTELAHKLSVLVVDLHLVRRTALCHNNVT